MPSTYATSRAGVHAAAPRAPRATSRHPRRSSHVSSHGPALRAPGYGLRVSSGCRRRRPPSGRTPCDAHRCAARMQSDTVFSCELTAVTCAFHDSSPPPLRPVLPPRTGTAPAPGAGVLGGGRLGRYRCAAPLEAVQRSQTALRAESRGLASSTRLWRVWYVALARLGALAAQR